MHRVVGGFIWDAFGDTLADIVELARSVWNRDAKGAAFSGGAMIVPGISAGGLKRIGGKADELLDAGIDVAARGVSFGRNATSKLRSHWGDIRSLAQRAGVEMPSKFKQAGGQIESFIDNIVRTGDTRVGPYKPTGGGWQDALWSKKGDAIVVRSPEGQFVTILDAAGEGAAKNFPGGL
jgi:hypothetical protein